MFKNSGKLKLQPRKTAEALNITYRLPTMNGTRLIGHCLSVLKRLLNNQPALLTAFTGFLSSEHNNEKKKSCNSHRDCKQIKALSVLCTMAAYLDIVQNIIS